MANARDDRNDGTDVGRTSGGGNLGHDQPRDPADTSDIRNEANRQTPRRSETDDPVMPDDGSTLNTRI